jgi:hypothetical protein
MMKSARVTLTVLAGVAGAAHAQSANPCTPGTFNGGACKIAVKAHGYCDGGTWTPQQYQSYPYYYDLYKTYSTAGGVTAAAIPSACRNTARGGFGTHGIAAHSHGGS